VKEALLLLAGGLLLWAVSTGRLIVKRGFFSPKKDDFRLGGPARVPTPQQAREMGPMSSDERDQYERDNDLK
jgi:hypothetical protein